MGISEILSIEDGRRIRIYKRGMFWVAYERSALLLCTKKALQVQEKEVKAAGGVSVLSVGFPEQTRVFFCEAFGDFVFEGERSGFWELPAAAGELDFEALRRQYGQAARASEPLAGGAAMPATERVLAQIRDFRLAERSPMEALLFVQDLQSLLRAEENQMPYGHLR
jgi:hypothetical protein